MIIIGIIGLVCTVYSVVAVVGVGAAAGASYHNKKKRQPHDEWRRNLDRQTNQLKYQNAVKENILLHRKLRQVQNQNNQNK